MVRHNSTMGANKDSADGKLIGKDFSSKEVSPPGGGDFGHCLPSPGHQHLEEPRCDGHQSHVEARPQHRASLSACPSPLGCTPDRHTNHMKFVQELSFAQHHTTFSHQGFKPVPVLDFFPLSPQDQPPGKLLQTHKLHRLSGTNFSRERSS